jgi:biopolymer transport protein ExbB
MNRVKPSLLPLLLVAVAFLAGASPAFAWWNPEWTLRKQITIDPTDTGVKIIDPVGSVAVLIRLHDGVFQFASAKDDGGDIRFVAADDKTLLPYHIEKYDSLLNEAYVWVKVPEVKPGAKVTFWMYYGNAGSVARADDAKATFDSDTVLAYHFGEKNAPPNDATSHGNNAQTAAISVDGSMIGGGEQFDGKAAITIPNSVSLTWISGGSLTWSAWIKPTALAPKAVIFSRREGANDFLIGLDKGTPFFEVNGVVTAATAPIDAGGWHHLAVTADGKQVTLYLDGKAAATAGAVLPGFNSPLTLGNDTAPGATGFTGELDELEIAKVARSAGYLQFVAAQQGGGDSATKLLALGEDEQPPTWTSWMNGGFLGVILKSLTVDGWIVIIILMIMSAVSWVIMFGKARFLNGISKGNARFMKEWRHVASDLSVLDEDDLEKVKKLGGRVEDKKAERSLREASLYRIYHIGVEEIRHRLNADRQQGSKILSARSIHAIRASLDGGLVRETQSLNRLLVLLTIAISGGPFLGLLGTVVGVMITFAAIAQAGDVNVNAIAPGIAAALAATVAGLVVAIPALFGYNYLVAQVKDATSDMQVFIDEFVTKMAEFYGDAKN